MFLVDNKKLQPETLPLLVEGFAHQTLFPSMFGLLCFYFWSSTSHGDCMQYKQSKSKPWLTNLLETSVLIGGNWLSKTWQHSVHCCCFWYKMLLAIIIPFTWLWIYRRLLIAYEWIHIDVLPVWPIPLWHTVTSLLVSSDLYGCIWGFFLGVSKCKKATNVLFKW